MGCDIHPHFEVKVDGVWHHHSVPHFERCYRLFTKMANVRTVDEVEPISEPRGLPEDVSVITRIESKFDNGHSHSWLNAKEIKELYEFHISLADNDLKRINTSINEWWYLCGNGWEGFECDSDGYPSEYEDIRLVFWFDN